VQSFSFVDRNAFSQFTAFIVLPKALSPNASSLPIQAAEGIEFFPEKNLVVFTPKEFYSLDLNFGSKAIDSCIIAVIVPTAWYNNLESDDKRPLLETVLGLDTGLDCEKTSLLENAVGYNLNETFNNA
jgi:hypothetical protein